MNNSVVVGRSYAINTQASIVMLFTASYLRTAAMFKTGNGELLEFITRGLQDFLYFINIFLFRGTH